MSAQFQSQGAALASLFVAYIVTIATVTGIAIKQHPLNQPREGTLSITPPPFISTTPPVFADISDIPQRKVAFFNFFRTLIHRQKQQTEQAREALTHIEHRTKAGKLNKHEMSILNKLKKKYDVEVEDQQEASRLLKRRINIIPESMVLAQAA